LVPARHTESAKSQSIERQAQKTGAPTDPVCFCFCLSALPGCKQRRAKLRFAGRDWNPSLLKEGMRLLEKLVLEITWRFVLCR